MTAAADHAGPAVLISFAISPDLAVCSPAFATRSFRQLIPESGSSYTYAYATMGRFMAWFIGWNMVLEYLGSPASAVVVGWFRLFHQPGLNNAFAFSIPAAFAMPPIAGPGFNELHLTGAILNCRRCC